MKAGVAGASPASAASDTAAGKGDTPASGEDAPPSPPLDVLEFRLAHERYAVETRWVREVHALRSITPLPGTPGFVAGMVHLRGRVLAVIDLRRFFGLPRVGLTDLHRIVRLGAGAGQVELGVLADLDLDLVSLDRRQLQPPAAAPAGIDARFVRGVAPCGTVVLDAARILADPRLAINDLPVATP